MICVNPGIYDPDQHALALGGQACTRVLAEPDPIGADKLRPSVGTQLENAVGGYPLDAALAGKNFGIFLSHLHHHGITGNGEALFQLQIGTCLTGAIYETVLTLFQETAVSPGISRIDTDPAFGDQRAIFGALVAASPEILPS